jgi:hypothetical protein
VFLGCQVVDPSGVPPVPENPPDVPDSPVENPEFSEEDINAFVEAKRLLVPVFEKWFSVSIAGRKGLEGRFMGAFRAHLTAAEHNRRTTVLFRPTTVRAKRPLPRTGKTSKVKKHRPLNIPPVTLHSEFRNPGSFTIPQITATEPSPEWARQMFLRHQTDLFALKKETLKSMCRSVGKPVSGNKNNLIGHLNTHFNGVESSKTQV